LPFRDIAGQDQATRILRKSVANHRLPHAYLFTGVEGVGKTMAATALAEVLNCDQQGTDSCGKCEPCRRIAGGNFPDFRHIGPEGPGASIKIETVRDLRSGIYVNPIEGKYKVYLISNADRMTEKASNALLKVLEEPPRNSLLILATSYPHLVLDTIKSRCQRLHFRQMGSELVAQIIMQKRNVPEAMANLAARLGEGSPGRALSLLDRGFADREEIIELLEAGEVPVERIFSFARETAQKFRQAPERMLWLYQVVLNWYRDLYMLSLNHRDLLNRDRAQQLSKQANGLSPETFRKALKTILQIQKWTHYNVNARLALEVLLIELNQVQAKGVH